MIINHFQFLDDKVGNSAVLTGRNLASPLLIFSMVETNE
jgi:hypothetical protein